jgi:hypothetical protein
MHNYYSCLSRSKHILSVLLPIIIVVLVVVVFVVGLAILGLASGCCCCRLFLLALGLINIVDPVLETAIGTKLDALLGRNVD